MGVWQILVSILPEFTNTSNNAATDDNNNCSSPWSDYCPPKQKVIHRRVPVPDEDDVGGSAEKTVAVASFPPSFLIESATLFCKEEAVQFTATATAAAAAASDGTSSCGSHKNNEDNNNVNDKEKADASMMSALSQYNNDEDESSFD